MCMFLLFVSHGLGSIILCHGFESGSWSPVHFGHCECNDTYGLQGVQRVLCGGASNRETFIQKNLPYITLDTVLFHAYFVLEYRIDHTQVSINDKLVETAFDFLGTFIPAYTQAFRNNEKNCLHRCLSLFVHGV